MPMTSAQLATLVEATRARQKAAAAAPPLPPKPKKALPPLQPAPAASPQAPAPRSTAPTKPAPSPRPPSPTAAAQTATPTAQPPLPAPTPLLPTAAAEPENFPTGWVLSKESWHFHRRFFRVCRRPMAHGEYSGLLKQIHQGQAEHLDSNCWRVTLSDGNTLMVRADAARWTLHTILPRDWRPPALA